MTKETTTDVDIAVLGGGPAGSLTARLLATLGYDVALVSKRRRATFWEGLSARAVEGLRVAGCDSALEVIGPEVQRIAHWNGELAATNRERVIDRSRFDTALCGDAKRAGVRHVVGRVAKCEATNESWEIRIHRGRDSTQTMGAGMLVEGRGREAPLRRGFRTHGRATMALCRAWRLPPKMRAITRVSSFHNGWAWFAAGDDGHGMLQLVVGAEKGMLPGRSTIQRFYDDTVSSTDELRHWPTAAVPFGPVTARHASPTIIEPVIEDRVVRVGDAAVAIDPLSGHGMFEAIGSALAAAPVVNTILRRPQDAELARQYYRERATHTFVRHARVGREFYAQEQRWSEQPFWRDRRTWPDDEPAHASPFDIKPSVAMRPVIKGNFVVLEEVMLTPDHPRGVWQVAGVPLVRLLRLLNDHSNSFDAATARLECSPSAVATARDWLSFRGLL